MEGDLSAGALLQHIAASCHPDEIQNLSSSMLPLFEEQAKLFN